MMMDRHLLHVCMDFFDLFYYYFCIQYWIIIIFQFDIQVKQIIIHPVNDLFCFMTVKKNHK